MIPVGTIPSDKPTVWPNKDIDKPQEAGRLTGKLKECEGCTFLKKPWLMHLLHLHPSVIGYLKITSLWSLLAIFAVEKVWLWNIFPDGAMGDGIQQPISDHLDILEELMVNRKPLVCDRIRKIDGSFAWIGHRFLRGGFFASLSQNELLLYFFLVLVADRQGLSHYHYDKICSLLCLSLDDYIVVRDQLIEKDLIAFDGTFFQVLSLPKSPVTQAIKLLQNRDDMETFDLATIKQIMRKQLSRDHES
ncbi:hypothetical protein JCM39068_38310 [Desulfocastanea catecholica]